MAGVSRILPFLVALAVSSAAYAESGTPPSENQSVGQKTQSSWPENDLETLLVAAAANPDRRAEFFSALLKTEVCALTIKTGSAIKSQPVPLVGIRGPDGERALALFTAPNRAAEQFGAGTLLACTKGAVLLEAMRGNRVVLDPGQPYGFVWTPEEIDHLLGVERVIDKSTNVQLGIPDNVPSVLIQHLRSTFGSEPRIMAAWLALAYWPDQRERSWYLDVHTDLERTKIEELVRDATGGIDMAGQPLDLVIHQPDSEPGTGIVVAGHQAFGR